MTTIRQLIQTGPAKANELFARLVDTSETAVKTRDRLFSELRAELEMLANLEEEHLFPVLKKYKGTKTLATEALRANRQTRKLLAELERTPKDGEEFATKVADLKKVFQQHVRDEKNELLPAILKALSDEEADALVEKIEDKKAEIDAERRAEIEERRAAARREREEVEAAEQAAENIANTISTGIEGARQFARTSQNAVQNGFGNSADVAQRSMGQLMAMFGLAGQETGKRGEPTATSTTVLLGGYQDLAREWLDMSQKRFQTNLDGLNAIARCRSFQEFVAAQSSLIRSNFALTMENSRRLAELSVGAADNAAVSLNEQQSVKSTRRRGA